MRTAMNDLAQQWLNLVCQMLPKVSSAIVVLRDASDPVAVWSHGSSKHGAGSISTQSPNLGLEQSEEHEALMSVVALAKQQCAAVLIDKSDQQKLLIDSILINPRNRSDNTIDKSLDKLRGW